MENTDTKLICFPQKFYISTYYTSLIYRTLRTLGHFVFSHFYKDSHDHLLACFVLFFRCLAILTFLHWICFLLTDVLCFQSGRIDECFKVHHTNFQPISWVFSCALKACCFIDIHPYPASFYEYEVWLVLDAEPFYWQYEPKLPLIEIDTTPSKRYGLVVYNKRYKISIWWMIISYHQNMKFN